MLHWFLPYNKVIQPQVCPLPIEPHSHSPIPPLQVVTKPYAEVLCDTATSHQLSISHMIMCNFQCYSLNSTLSLPSCVHNLSSMSVPLFLSCKQVHQYHFPNFHIQHAMLILKCSFSNRCHSIIITKEILNPNFSFIQFYKSREYSSYLNKKKKKRERERKTVRFFPTCIRSTDFVAEMRIKS